MEYSVYKIIEPTSGEVVYVGQTKRLKLRIKEHTYYNYPSRPAKFLGYDSAVIEDGLNKVNSLEREAYWKDHYNIEKTETANRTWIRKMNFEQAEEMRSLYATGDYTYADLIKRFPVNSSCSVFRILKNITYKS